MIGSPDLSQPAKDPQLRARAKALFQQVFELHGAARDRLVAEASATDPDLRLEVLALLAGLAQAESVWREAPTADLVPGQQLDRYRILRQLGAGGFGTVWAAEQQEPVRRAVAVKVLKAGMDTHEVVARFEAERQALAVMEHPNVAKVFDAGATPGGRPYFVMELVDGKPITEHCDGARLPLAERIALFGAVCQAVQHAHHKGVVHRDLKPSNVLVAVHEGTAVPKVIDFGIAKATDRDGRFPGVTTAGPQILGTPDYMAPEQAEGTCLDVDARADVYSLGVLLYELLTGTRPFASLERGPGRIAETLRVIREVDPPRPSTQVTSAAASNSGVAALRATTPRLLASTLRSGLDWIVMKALAKDRSRRYQTPRELAEDLARFLRHEPVHAGPPSRGYRLRTYVRRHRVLVTAATVVVVSLVVGGGMAASGYVEAKAREKDALEQKAAAETARQLEQEQREQATTQAQKALAVIRLLRRMLGSSDPHEARGQDFTVRALLEQFDRELGQDLAKEPEVEAAVRATVGGAYTGLGMPQKAEAHLSRALALRREHCGEHSLEVAQSTVDWIEHLHATGRYAEALELSERIVAIPDLQARDPELAASARIYHADFLHHLGQFERAVRECHDTLAVLESGPVPLPRAAASARNILALTLLASGDPRAAAQEFRDLVKIQIQHHGKEHVTVATTCNNLALALDQGLELDEAAQMARRGLSIRLRLLHAEHPDVAASKSTLGSILQHQGRLDEGEEQVKAALQILYRNYGQKDHPGVAATLNALGAIHEQRGSYAEAAKTYRDALAMTERVHGPEYHEVAALMRKLGDALAGLGDFAGAEEQFRSALERSSAALGPDCRAAAIAKSGLGWVIAMQGRFAEAEPICQDALKRLRRHVPDEHPDIPLNLLNLAHVHTNLGMLDDAEAGYRKAIELKGKVLGKRSPELVSPWVGLGEMYERKGALAEAVAAHQEALAILRACAGEDDEQVAAARRHVGRLLARSGRHAEARELFTARVERDRKFHGTDSPILAESLMDLGLALLHLDQAEPAVDPLRESLAIRTKQSADQLLRHESMAVLGRALFRAGHTEEAERLLAVAAARLDAANGADADALRRSTLGWLIELYEKTSRDAEAEPWRQKLKAR